MLEILATLRRTWGTGTIGGANKTGKNAGDIICIKKSPANWGLIERIIKKSAFRVDLSKFTGTEGLDPNIIVTQPTPLNGAHD